MLRSVEAHLRRHAEDLHFRAERNHDDRDQRDRDRQERRQQIEERVDVAPG